MQNHWLATVVSFVGLTSAACGDSALPTRIDSCAIRDGIDAGPDAPRAPRDAGLPAATRPDGGRSGAGAARDATTPPDSGAATPSSDAGSTDAAPPTLPERDEDDGGAASTRDAAAPLACSPTQPPFQRETCESEGEVCSHWTTNASGTSDYFACVCLAASSSELVWSCYESVSGTQCPHERPEHGSSCAGYRDRTCPYPPRVSCACPLDAADLVWSCSEPPVAPEAPPSLPAATPVRALTDADRQSFCDWFIESSTDPQSLPKAEAQPTADGYYPSTGCWGCGGGVGFDCMTPLSLPSSACADNLALSTCEAPLSELIDCARSLISSCWPSPRGCARYLESPGCSGTLVTRTNDRGPQGTSDCRLKVR